MAGKIWRWLRGPRNPSRVPVVVYVRGDCSLCDDALALLEKHRQQYSLDVELRDVDESPELASKYGDRVPVILIDGRERLWGKISEPLLLRNLAARRS